MHCRGIFLRDIKPENLAIGEITNDDNEVSRRIFFIDTDETVLPDFDGYGQKDTGQYTPAYLTLDIKIGRDQGNVESLKIGDEYAMLVSIIETTSTDSKLKSITYFEGNELTPPETIITSDNTDSVMTWIHENIKKEFRIRVFNFLSSPTTSPLPCSLFHVIRW